MPTTEAAGGLRPRPFVSGVVLAAGASSRLGRPKQLLPLGDRPLLQHVVDAALASCLDEVIVVLGHGAAEIRAALELPDGALVVVNPHADRGQSASLQCGLNAAAERSQAAAVLLADQPGVAAALIDRVVAAFLASDAPAARPVYPQAGGVPGHPVLLARSTWRELATLSGDRGARTLLAAHPDWLLTVPAPGDPPADVDTQADYERVAKGFAATAGAR